MTTQFQFTKHNVGVRDFEYLRKQMVNALATATGKSLDEIEREALAFNRRHHYEPGILASLRALCDTYGVAHR